MLKPVRNHDEMNTIQKEAFGLAVAYNAYQEALAVEADKRTYRDWNGILVWGNTLIKHQEFFGIEIVPKLTIENAGIEARKAKNEIGEISMPAIEASF